MPFMPCATLTESQVEEVHEHALRVIEETGFTVQSDTLLASLVRAGAHVETASGRVWWPRGSLVEYLTRAPASYTIRGIVGQAWTVGGGAQGVFAITNDPWILESRTGEVRRPRLDDVRRHTILGQQLERVVCMSCMDFPVADVAEPDPSLRAFEAHVLHHAKHYAVFPASTERLRLWIELGAVLNGGAPVKDSGLMTCAVAVVSPLTVSSINADLLLDACAQGFPILPTICPMAGTTAPYSMAGTLLLAHAENLMMAGLTQLVRPGNPFLYAIGPSVSDLRTGHDRYYTLDKVLWKVAGVQMARRCGFPTMAECGGTMPPRLDVQGGAESMLFMLAARASGADILSGLGSCYNANGLSPEYMVIQEEWLRAADFLARGIVTEGRASGVESLRNAGPGGDFLTDELTLEHMHGGAFFDPDLLDYSGGLSIEENARQRADAMVEGFVSPVPEPVGASVRRFFADKCGAGALQD